MTMLTPLSPIAEREISRRRREREFEESVLDYVSNPHRYQFGGVLNAISTLRSTLEKLGETHPNYLIAAKTLLDAEIALDLDYRDPV